MGWRRVSFYGCRLTSWSSYSKVKRGRKKYSKLVLVISRSMLKEVEDLIGRKGTVYRDGNKLIAEFE